MREAYSLVWSVLVLLLRSRVSLEAEILILRHQLNIQRRHLPKRLAFSAMDRLIFVGLYRLAPNTIKALTIVKPDAVIRWHRAGFRLYWRWKSRHRCGRPTVPLEIRRLIRGMRIANPLWERRASMESFSSSASRSARPAWPSIWCGGGPLPRGDGRRSFATMLRALPQCRRADDLVPAALRIAHCGP
jgi:hypothetical protein